MTTTAFVLLIIYVAGFFVTGAVALSMTRGETDPDDTAEEREAVTQMERAAETEPGLTSGLLAVAVVFWFVLPVVAGLAYLQDRSRGA